MVNLDQSDFKSLPTETKFMSVQIIIFLKRLHRFTRNESKLEESLYIALNYFQELYFGCLDPQWLRENFSQKATEKINAETEFL